MAFAQLRIRAGGESIFILNTITHITSINWLMIPTDKSALVPRRVDEVSKSSFIDNGVFTRSVVSSSKLDFRVEHF